MIREPEEDMQSLRDEITRLFAAVLQTDADCDEAIALAQQEHDADMANMEAAVASRDLIGQAKGIIIAAMGCSSDEAFGLLVKRSQHENRKVIDIAGEIVTKAQRPK